LQITGTVGNLRIGAGHSQIKDGLSQIGQLIRISEWLGTLLIVPTAHPPITEHSLAQDNEITVLLASILVGFALLHNYPEVSSNA
jgi:hypothetical protein